MEALKNSLERAQTEGESTTTAASATANEDKLEATGTESASGQS
jgi:hypothetical protein